MIEETEHRLMKLEADVDKLIANHKTEAQRIAMIDAKLDTVLIEIRDLVALWHNAKTFGTVVYWVGTTIKWAGAVAAAAVGIWYLIRGKLP